MTRFNKATLISQDLASVRGAIGVLRKSMLLVLEKSQNLSLALHYLPFASRFPLPHFTLAVLFALSLYPPSLFASFSRLLLFVCVGAWDSSVISYWIDTLVLKN